MEVSWLVTGIRRDRYAERHPVVVEEEKPESRRGTYLHAAEWDQPVSHGTAGGGVNDPAARARR
jgi:hypothetical protein